MKKVRLCRAIEANVGERRRYKKQLLNLQRQFQRYVFTDIMNTLNNENALTLDSALDTDKELISKLKNKTLKQAEVPELIITLNRIISKRSVHWRELLNSASFKIVERFVKKTVQSTSRAQQQALIVAGVKPSLLKSRWSVPVVGKQFISPEVAQQIPDYVKSNVELITKICENDVNRISEVITKGLSEGMDYDALRAELNATNGFDSARADRVALDQINKINQQVQILNAQSLGCTHGRWKHVPGQYTSRKTHIEFDNKIFPLNKGLYDSEVGQYVLPAVLPFCRCISRLVLPDEVTEE